MSYYTYTTTAGTTATGDTYTESGTWNPIQRGEWEDMIQAARIQRGEWEDMIQAARIRRRNQWQDLLSRNPPPRTPTQEDDGFDDGAY